ncbi:Thioesterase superfamily protein [uncultured Alphaproteobacteria bacterium]|uniref:Thioesterase superfamily protein n=1 Tax=uncultured Alphaproteobacteria bacterium TaxID=91750 RepID=A0A212IZW1_9PROT|nr:Thioesterase superfamily protein [uncultured Alphaproteobacteria bacterium]
MDAIQDAYADDVGHCYGCGRLNPHGHRLKSYWEGGVAVARFTPEPFHTAIPGFVYGGLIASLIDCHATGIAAAAAAEAEGVPVGSLRFVTARLEIDYLAPTPIGCALDLLGVPVEVKGRKVVAEVTLAASGALCARARAVLVRMPETMTPSARG